MIFILGRKASTFRIGGSPFKKVWEALFQGTVQLWRMLH